MGCFRLRKKICLLGAQACYRGPRGFLLMLPFLFGNLQREALIDCAKLREKIASDQDC